MSELRRLNIKWLGTMTLEMNGTRHALSVPEDQREHFARILLRAYDMGKNARSLELSALLRGDYE
jgi:hypothetical protein